MKTTLQLEELAMFLGGMLLFYQLDVAFWWFFVLLLVPDVGAMGYAVNNTIGAFVYNLFHHRGLAVLLYILGMHFAILELQVAGIILFSHAAMDRFFGFGLKYEKGFKFTHLGKIGKE